MNSYQAKSEGTHIMAKKESLLLTEGPITKQIILYTLPLMGGLIFQQLYSVVDTIVVGKFINDAALAAIGSTSPTINMLIGFMIGMTTGIGVLVAQFFGAGDFRHLRQTACTSVLVCLIGGLIVTAIGIAAAPALLRFLKTPEDVMGPATVYLRCYFSGGVFISLYNMGASILRSVGDSRRPLFILIVSSIANIILDLLFVLVFDMGMLGVGLATMLAQVLSGIMVLAILVRTQEAYGLPLFRKNQSVRQYLSLSMAKRIFVYGFPSGIQQTIVSFSNMLVQSHINVFGSTVIAGWSAYWRLSDCGMLPVNALVLTATTYVGQHYGSGDFHRLKKGMNRMMLISSIYTVILGLIIWGFCSNLLTLFTDETSVIACGRDAASIVLIAYLPLTLFQILTSGIRGFGKNFMAMLISAGNGCGLRLLYLYTLDFLDFSTAMKPVFASYPVTWINTLICALVYYLYLLRREPPVMTAASDTAADTASRTLMSKGSGKI